MGFLGLIGFGGGATGLAQGTGGGANTGGYMLTPGDGYVYHVFMHPNSDDLVLGSDVPSGDYLLVGGGGSGGSSGGNTSGCGGGGGAGGVRATNDQPFSAGTYTVTVGAGGPPCPTGDLSGPQVATHAGGYSQIGPQPAYGRAVGGAHGGTKGMPTGGHGASGGGGWDWAKGGTGQNDATYPGPTSEDMTVVAAATPTALYLSLIHI